MRALRARNNIVSNTQQPAVRTMSDDDGAYHRLSEERTDRLTVTQGRFVLVW
jgi:hypothetical protein